MGSVVGVADHRNIQCSNAQAVAWQLTVKTYYSIIVHLCRLCNCIYHIIDPLYAVYATTSYQNENVSMEFCCYQLVNPQKPQKLFHLEQFGLWQFTFHWNYFNPRSRWSNFLMDPENGQVTGSRQQLLVLNKIFLYYTISLPAVLNYMYLVGYVQ